MSAASRRTAGTGPFSPPQPERRLVIAVEGFREGRTGGVLFWGDLIERCRERGLPVRAEDDAAPRAGIWKRLLMAPWWNLRAFGAIRHGVLLIDQSGHGRVGLLVRRVRSRPEVRVVAVVHHLRESFRFRNRLYRSLARNNESVVLRSCDRVIVHTEATRNRVAARGVPRERIEVIRQGWREDVPRIPVRELGPGEPMRLLWVGGDFDRKGLDVLLGALARASAPLPRLTVVGSPEASGESRRARRLARVLGVEEQVRFLGVVERADLDRLWLEHDVYVLPSRQEGHGRAVDEALNHGMPLLLSDLADFRERLRPEDARFVPTGDPDALAAAMNALRDRPLRANLSERGWERSRGFPTWDETLDAHVRFLEDILRSAKRP